MHSIFSNLYAWLGSHGIILNFISNWYLISNH